MILKNLVILLTLIITSNVFAFYKTYSGGSNDKKYFLSEYVENNRKYFNLFVSNKDQIQDLILTKSFSLKEFKLADKFKNDLIKKYFAYNNTNIPKNFENIEPEKLPPLWIATNEWSPTFEIEYGKWVSQNFNSKFLIENKISTDCADVAFALRWIFARINLLPMANHLGGSKQLFTNESMKKEWLSLETNIDWKKDLRFKKALNFLMQNTFTHTLMEDSYPLEINTKILTPGSYHLALFDETGHTMIVDTVNEINKLPITMLYSTTPSEVRELMGTYYQETEAPVLNKSGFYKIRWAVKKDNKIRLMNSKDIPGYSIEQFNLPNDDQSEPDKPKPHYLKIFKLINPNFSFELMVQNSFNELLENIKNRIEIVEKGFEYCQKNDCTPGSIGDENWSTPNRDKRILKINDNLDQVVLLLKNTDEVNYNKWKLKIKDQSEKFDFKINNKTYNLTEILISFYYSLYDSSPVVSINERWGLDVVTNIKKIQKDFDSTIQIRKNYVEKAEVCRMNFCNFDTENFKNLSTTLIDFELRKKWSGILNLCYLKPTVQCDEFKNSHLFKELEKSLLWVSDPNVEIEKRWGGPGKIFHSSENIIESISFDKKWVNINNQLISTTDQSEIKFNQNEKLGQFHQKLNLYFTYEVQKNLLRVSIYKFPSELVSSFDLSLSSNSKPRIWWTSSSKSTISIFLENDFYEIDQAGKILNTFNYISYENSQIDNTLNFIKTKQGTFFSDSTKDASKFILMPLSTNQFKLFKRCERKNNGWLFYSDERMIYIEKSGIILDWKFEKYYSPMLTADGNLAFLYNNQTEKTDLYKRNQNKFTLIKTIDGFVNNLSSKYFLTYKEVITQIYSQSTLKPITLPCTFTENVEWILLNDDFYMCRFEHSTEIYNFNGKLIKNFNSNALFWNFASGDSGSNWLGSAELQNDNFSVNTFYNLKNNKLIGPYLSSTYNISQFNLEEDFQSNNTRNENEIAPSSFRTNYGVIVDLPNVSNFILEISLNKKNKTNFLFLPNEF